MHLILAALTFTLLIGISFFSEFMKRRMLPKTVPDGPALQQAFAGSMRSVPVLETPAVAVLPKKAKSTPHAGGYALPESLFYHQGHAWVALQDSGMVVVGVDEYTSKLLGKVTSVRLPRLGETCRQGTISWTLCRDEKEIDMLSPLDGQVVAVNKHALEDPDLISRDPFGNGWLMMIQPRELKRNLRNLISGSVARSWMEESAAGLRSMFGGKLGMVFQDGGLPKDGLVEQFSQKDWQEFVNRVFMIEPEDHPR